MKVRLGLVVAASLAVGAGACASGGGGGGGGGGAAPEGNEPRQTAETTQSTLYLGQAQSAESDSVAENRYRQALEAANQGIAADSTNPMAYYHAALSLVMLQEDYERADSLLDTALDLYPAYEEELEPVRQQAWVDLYNAAIDPLNQGDLDEAARLLELASEMYDGRSEALLNLGSIYVQQGETQQAIQVFEEAVEITQRQQDQLESQPDSVRAQLEEGISQNESIAIQNLAQLYQQEGQTQAVVDLWSEYLDRNPDDIQALSSYAAALSQAEMPDSATAIYEDLLSRPGLDAREYGFIGIGLFQAEEWDQAAEAFAAALEQNPSFRDAAVNLTLTYFNAEQWDQVLETADRVLELDPRNGSMYQLQARAHAESGDPQAGGRRLDDYQGLDFEIEQLELLPAAGGGGIVQGIITNRSVPQGEPITLAFTFVDVEGNEIASQEQTVPAPAADESAPLEVNVTADEPLGGFSYEVVRP